MNREVLSWVVTGGTAAAMVKLIENLLLWRLSRKEKHRDEEKAVRTAGA